MNLISWNVAGLRACLKKGFIDFVRAESPDIICLQETKMERGQAVIDLPEYSEYWNSAQKKGYSGTAVFVKMSEGAEASDDVLSAAYGIGIEEHDMEGRVITLEFAEFYLVNVYTPNSKRELERLDYRMVWEDEFRAYTARLGEVKPVIICGDLNVAHKEIDLKHPRQNRRNAGFTDEERGKMTELLDAGMIDTYRHFYPGKADAYSWWSYMGNARANNSGWRIDYFLASRSLEDRIADARIYSEIYGSDHCPVGLILA